MAESNPATLPLLVSVTIPLLLSLPCAYVLYSLHQKRYHTWSFDITNNNNNTATTSSSNVGIPTAAPLARHTTKQADGRKKSSLAALDIMSFLGRLQHTRNEPQLPESEATSAPPISDPSATLAKLLRPAITSYTISILLSLVCGAIYLSCLSTATNHSNAINLPLGVSVTCVPFVCFAYTIQGYLSYHRTSPSTSSSSSKLSFRRWRFSTGLVVALPVLASVFVASLGAWVSAYIVIGFLIITLCASTILTTYTYRRTITGWMTRVRHQRHSSGSNRRRQTRSWFSGTAAADGLTVADAEALARQGQMPRPGEKQEEFVARMQHDGVSWITETGNGTRSRIGLLSSSFSYSATSMSGASTPVTPHTPGTAFPRGAASSSKSSVATTSHPPSTGSGNQKSRISSSLSNSWITEPTESGVTMSPWRFDASGGEEVPPVPALTASTKARYGIPVPASSSQPAASAPAAAAAAAGETTFCGGGEGPSIVHIGGDPANMTFASYDSLPIKHGKRSTHFEILSPPAKTRPSKSPSVVSFRKRARQQRTASEGSEESFHSARNDPCQSIERGAGGGGVGRGDPNQSFPHSVSTSLEDEIFCDARGGSSSAADNVSIHTDAVETVADEDELRDQGRYGYSSNDDNLPPLLAPSARFNANGQRLPMTSTSNRGASSSESEIFMPIHLGISGQHVLQSGLPGMPKGSRGTYSSYSSLASPMLGGYYDGGGGGTEADKKSTDPLLMRGGKMSVTSEVMSWYRRAGGGDQAIMDGAGLGGEEYGRSGVVGKHEFQSRQLSWMALGNLLVFWISFALAMPLLIKPAAADVLATSLYLVALGIPAMSLVTSWFTLQTLLLPPHIDDEDKRASKLRPFMLQSQSAEVKSEQHSTHPKGFLGSRWRTTALKDKLRLPTLKFRQTRNSATHGGNRITQGRPSSERFDRLTHPSVPQPQIAIPRPVADIGKQEAEVVEDTDDTPRPYRFRRYPIDSAFDSNPRQVDDDRFSAYSILHGQGGRVSPIMGYPISPSRSEGTVSRPDSMTSSPGAKSIKLASVQHAVRGRMSLGPSFLMGGSQGETIIRAGRNVDLEAAIRAEIEGSGGSRERTYSTEKGKSNEVARLAPRVSEDQSRFQSTNRRSTDILGEIGMENKQERRRTFDFGRVWSGWKRSHEKVADDPELAFVDVSPERMEAIMMSGFGNTKPAPGDLNDVRISTSDRTFGGRQSVSTVRESHDLPAFRASEDFILPGQQGDYPSVDFGRPSIAQDDRASFSVEGHTDVSISTPRYPRQRNISRGPGTTLPELTAVNFLAEFKGAIRELGLRAEDTPAREAVRTVLASLATPRVATKKGSSTSIRGILKSRPSTEARKIGSSASIGHSLPPIPIDIAKSLAQKGSTYSVASTGRSTPVVSLEEGPTSASHLNLSLPPPRNVHNVGKASLGPLFIALHTVTEREETVIGRNGTKMENSTSKSTATPPQNPHFLAVNETDTDPTHDRSASTNTAIEEIETIMTMDSPTTASYLKANLSRPQSVVTESYVGPISAPANAHQHSLQASQSTQRTGSYPALKSSRSTPAFALASDWTSSRPTGDVYARPSSANDRPSSTYSYLEKELGLPPLPIRDATSSVKLGSRTGSKTEVQRQLLGEVTTNAARTTQKLPAEKETGHTVKVRRITDGPEDVENTKGVDEKGRTSPRKSVRKPKVQASTRVGENDASVRVMRF